MVQETGVSDYKMHPKHSVKGEPFASYVTFLINGEGNIYKFNGSDPKSSKWDAAKFKDINEFLVKNKLRDEL